MAEFLNCAVNRMEYVPAVRTYDEYLDAFEKYDDEKFRKRFRFSKNSVNSLVNLLEPALRRVSGRKCTITPEIQVLTALRYYANGSFQMKTGDTIGISQPAVSKTISAVSAALCDRIGDFIKFPTAAQLPSTKVKFYDIAGFPGVIGAIDCTHIRIVRPHENEEQFVNRKGFHSLNVQAICDAECRFTNVFVKWPGGTHDSFILRDSAIWAQFEADPTCGLILGDSGYPCRYWLMTPFEAPATQAHEKFNEAQKKTRNRIEQGFGQLKRRFNFLHQENRRSLKNVVLDIGAAFVLHNFAKSVNDPDYEPLYLDEDGLGDQFAGHDVAMTGLERRERIANQLLRVI